MLRHNLAPSGTANGGAMEVQRGMGQDMMPSVCVCVGCLRVRDEVCGVRWGRVRGGTEDSSRRRKENEGRVEDGR